MLDGDGTASAGDHPALAGNLLDFLAWVAARPRTYADAMEAWRTSCPRLSAWEDATGAGLVRVEQAGIPAAQGQAAVLLTERGEALLDGSASVLPPARSGAGRVDAAP